MQRACIRVVPGVVLAVAGLAMNVPGAATLRAQAQAPERLPRFEVASVRLVIDSVEQPTPD